MDDKEIKRIIEAALFISGRNLTIEELARICESGNLGKIKRICDELKKEYDERNGGIKIYFSENSYIMDVAEDLEDKIMDLSPVKEISKTTLKVLSFIAYHQPVKQKDVIERCGYVRDSILKLENLGFIRRYKEKNYIVIETTKKFNEYFKITPDELKKRIEKSKSENSSYF